jgi:hypothetical protein
MGYLIVNDFTIIEKLRLYLPGKTDFLPEGTELGKGRFRSRWWKVYLCKRAIIDAYTQREIPYIFPPNMIKGKIHIVSSMKAQTGSRGTTVLFL